MRAACTRAARTPWPITSTSTASAACARSAAGARLSGCSDSRSRGSIRPRSSPCSSRARARRGRRRRVGAAHGPRPAADRRLLRAGERARRRARGGQPRDGAGFRADRARRVRRLPDPASLTRGGLACASAPNGDRLRAQGRPITSCLHDRSACMIVLLAFALLAGAGTALSPCVLPVLPALLSAGGSGGRRRPLGIVLGLSITFTIAIVGVASVVDGVGLGTDPLRDLAVAVLLAFGLALLPPGIAARIEAPLPRLARFGPRSRGEGFPSGLLVGGALGFVYTPCASPILAAVISVSAASGRTVVIAIAYAAGSALVLLALCLGGRRLLDRARRAGRGLLPQRA